MIPEKGQRVKCFMRSTMMLEGLVEEWSDTQIVLKSLDGESIMIVHRPSDDIVLTKIMQPDSIEEGKRLPSVSKNILETKEEIKEKLKEVIEPSGDIDVDKLNLIQLRKLVVDQEKQIIAHKKREHFGTPNNSKRVVSYSSPFGNPSERK